MISEIIHPVEFTFVFSTLKILIIFFVINPGLNFASYYADSSICLAAVQLMNKIGLPVSNVMRTMWLSTLTKALMNFILLDLKYFPISISLFWFCPFCAVWGFSISIAFVIRLNFCYFSLFINHYLKFLQDFTFRWDHAPWILQKSKL